MLSVSWSFEDHSVIIQALRKGSEGLPEEDGFRYILVIMDDLSNFVSLAGEDCRAEVTAKHLINWCKTMGVPRVWVNDTATHFKNRVIA